jgi:hypothetical protein
MKDENDLERGTVNFVDSTRVDWVSCVLVRPGRVDALHGP